MAANGAIFIGWNRPVPGKEQQAMKLWQDSMEYFEKLRTEGRIESFDPVLLTAHGGNLNGFVFIKGDQQELDKVRREDSFVENVIKGGIYLQDYGVVQGFVGDGLANVFGKWSKAIGA
ncbi:hypothetical protein HNR65_002829 [Desulfosalsimonas propionicica]|uniref:YCII-related domain-containing protein n=1 Tax=Desulfosalsimonas propionicica TaxID=332175 RepID=A0A7W0CB90_9BACT|nr:hypothetical protein [Desulfosalsimonas propionicica]MBA2882477.1 hypothetical protein [Desulfosalsimonas propionicica]